jgi:two-component system chemotaxis sensor kinase CheA
MAPSSPNIDPSVYLSLFLEEARENLATLNEKLLLLEAGDPPRTVLDAIFRAAHTLKGMSATMGFLGIAELTHAMEDRLEALRSQRVAPAAAVIDPLFACVDALAQSLDSVAQGGPDTIDPGLIARVAMFSHAEAKADDAPSLLPEFDSFERTVLAEAQAKGFKAYQVTVRLDPTCLLKGVRAYMVLTALEQAGEIIKAVPAVPELEEERFEQEFVLVLVSTEAAETLAERVRNVSEVAAVVVAEITALPPEAPAHPTPTVPDPTPPAPTAPDPDLPAAPARHDAAEAAPPEPSTTKTPTTVRVPTDRLDRLVNLVGELVIDRNRLMEHGGSVPELSEIVRHVSTVISELQNVAMKLRMTPVERVFNRFPRMVRDLSRELGKDLQLVIEGQDTELDRLVIDEIGDPLVHLLRNAIDHGIEEPSERLAAGKPSMATIRLSARHEGNHVLIEVADDGRGIDSERIVATAVSRGLLTAEEAACLGEKQAYDLLFTPGFSTRETANAISGRGVGMDAVKSKVLSLGGAVDLTSTVGSGSTVTVMLPLTLAIIPAMLVEAGSTILALPLSFVEEAVDLLELSVQRVQDAEMVVLHERSLRLVRLVQALGIRPGPKTGEEAVVVIRVGSKKAGLVVDRLLGQQEVVIKPISRLVGKLDHLSGAAILGDGRLALILDAASLV